MVNTAALVKLLPSVNDMRIKPFVLQIQTFFWGIVMVITLCCFFGAATGRGAQETNRIQTAPGAKANAIYRQVMSALSKGDLVLARASFEKVLQLAPNSPEAHNSLGWVMMAQGEIDDATAEFHTALRLNPQFALAHMNLSNALVRSAPDESPLRTSAFDRFMCARANCGLFR